MQDLSPIRLRGDSIDLRFFPRAVGNPRQYIVHTPDEFNQFITDNNGKAPVFTSHNAFSSFDEKGQPTSVHMRNVCLDLDSKDKPENALMDAIRFHEWAAEGSLPHSVIFSGEKGFHCYLYLKPEIYPLDEHLRRALRALQLHIVSACRMRTADDRTIGDARRLMRIPYTKWASFDGRTIHQNGRHAFVVPVRVLLNADIQEIHELSKHPTNTIPDYGSTPWTLRSYLTHHRLLSADKRPTEPSRFTQYKEPNDDLLKAILPRPCIHGAILDPNPPHLVRFGAAVQLAEAGYPEDWIQSFFDDVALRAPWVDRHNAAARHYQVHHIVSRNYKPPGCNRLKEESLCIGPSCPFYIKVDE